MQRVPAPFPSRKQYPRNYPAAAGTITGKSNGAARRQQAAPAKIPIVWTQFACNTPACVAQSGRDDTDLPVGRQV